MTDLTNPRATVAALLEDVHALMNNMQTAAAKLQHWLNATAAAPAATVVVPVVAAPVPAPVVVAPAKRGRKPKEKHPVLEALTRMAKGWPAKTDLADTVVLLTPTHICTLPNAKVYWDYPCNTGLTSGRAAVSGRELLDVMKRAGAHAQLTASADSQSLQVEGDVAVRLRAQGGFTADTWDEQAASLQHRPPTKVLAHGVWSRATYEAAVAASSVCSKDATRSTLTNVLFDKEGYAVATDGHRLDVRPIHHDGESLLVPASVMPVLATCESSVFWEVNATHIRLIDADGVAFTFPRSTEQFPNWRHVMPSKDNTTFAISVDREALLLRTKVKPAGLPYWHCHLIDNELQVEEHGVDGATKFTIPVNVLERPDGDRCLPRFGLNYTYVRDMCEGSNSRYITLFVEDQLAPILCTPGTAVSYEHAVSLNEPVHIIMPVRI
jgi:hypothetical protein